MESRRSIIATLFTLMILVTGATQAQVIHNATNQQGGSHVISDQTTPYYSTTYSNLGFQEQTQAAPQQPTGDQSCQCQHCQEKAAKEAEAAKKAKAEKEAAIRAQMTGDWCGRRSCLAEKGFVYKASITNFYQGVTSGGFDQTFRWGAKIDQYFIFDSEKLGLWKGGKLIMHGESQLGQNSVADGALLAPVNTAMLFPLPNRPETAITNFQFIQGLNEEGLALSFGKFNFLDLWQMLYPEYGLGLDGFMNVSSVAPLSVVPTLPVVFNGVGLLKVGEKGVESGLFAVDPRNTQTVSGIDGVYDNGVTIFGMKRWFTESRGGLPGSHLIGGTYATGQYTSLDRQGWHVFPGQGLVPAQQTGSWLGAYVREQTLWADPCNEKRHIRFFGYGGIADPETSPFNWTVGASLEGFGLNPCRAGDRMGIAYFFTGLSEDFKDLPGHLVAIDDLQGGELYYNAEVTPWFHITADLQVVEPSISTNDTAVVFGIRAKIDL